MRRKTFKCVYPNLKEKIIAANLSCADLAEQLDVSTAAMYKRLYGETDFSPVEQTILCRLFKSKSQWLFLQDSSTIEQGENHFYSTRSVSRPPKAIDLHNLGIQPAPKGKSYGFYLDEEVVAALEQLARENGSSKSKVLNTLLRNLLL